MEEAAALVLDSGLGVEHQLSFLPEKEVVHQISSHFLPVRKHRQLESSVVWAEVVALDLKQKMNVPFLVLYYLYLRICLHLAKEAGRQILAEVAL